MLAIGSYIVFTRPEPSQVMPGDRQQRPGLIEIQSYSTKQSGMHSGTLFKLQSEREEDGASHSRQYSPREKSHFCRPFALENSGRGPESVLTLT
jgi:hypothetical protein